MNGSLPEMIHEDRHPLREDVLAKVRDTDMTILLCIITYCGIFPCTILLLHSEWSLCEDLTIKWVWFLVWDRG